MDFEFFTDPTQWPGKAIGPLRVSVRIITFEKMTFDLAMWLAG